MHIIKNDLISFLKKYEKHLDNIQYVIYAIYDTNRETKKYVYCNIDEFLDATASATCPFDINFMGDIYFMSAEWWLTYDYQGILEIHIQPPTKPIEHQKPKSDFLVNA